MRFSYLASFGADITDLSPANVAVVLGPPLGDDPVAVQGYIDCMNEHGDNGAYGMACMVHAVGTAARSGSAEAQQWLDDVDTKTAENLCADSTDSNCVATTRASIRAQAAIVTVDGTTTFVDPTTGAWNTTTTQVVKTPTKTVLISSPKVAAAQAAAIQAASGGATGYAPVASGGATGYAPVASGNTNTLALLLIAGAVGVYFMNKNKKG